MTTGLPSDEVAEDYKNSLEDLTLNSRYEISNLTVIAKENMDHALAISRVLENHIRTAPPNRKLPALYVLDSVVKNVGTPYTLFFGRNLYQTFMNAYTLVDGSVRKKLEEMLKTWKEPVPGSLDTRPVFPVDVTRNIENALIKARTAAVQLQQQQAKIQSGLTGIPWRGTSTPPLGPSDPRASNPIRSPQPAFAAPATIGAYGPPPGANGYGLPGGHPQGHYPASANQAGAPYVRPGGGYAATPSGIELLNQDIENLIASARTEFAMNPYDPGIQERLKALLDLQSILQSQSLPPEQVRMIKDQVAQLSASGRSQPQPAAQMAAPAAPPPEQPPMSSLFPPNALAALLASVNPPAPSNPPPSGPGPVASQPLSFIPPSLPASAPAPGGESSLLASLRAAGMLPPVATPPPRAPANPPAYGGAAASTMLGNFPNSTLPDYHGSAAASIPHDVELTSSSLKIARPHLISLLYEAQPNQCTLCARRFPPTETGRAKKARHLDWHFKVNLRMADAAKRGQNRSWYVDEVEWIRSRDADEELDTPASPEPDAAGARQASSKAVAKKQWIAVPDETSTVNRVCPICQEKFEPVWHDEAQEWVWIDAVRIGDTIYHVSCHAEASKDGVGPLAATPLLGKRKAEESESFPLRSKVMKEAAS
ncbi:MAG: hypothetical protein M1838_002163 [Thelocarpon superellum]|nr:MAG: hypothetical protein M1838_002163 [Thelocarpon superellum]